MSIDHVICILITTYIVPSRNLDWLSILASFAQSLHQSLNILLHDRLLLSESLIGEPVGQQLTHVGMLLAVSVDDDGWPRQAGVVLLVLGEFLLARGLVPVDLLELRGLYVRELVRGRPDHGAVAVVQLQEILGCGSSQVGRGGPP